MWYSPIIKILRVAKTIWRVINTKAPIWRVNMLIYLSLVIICSLKNSLPWATLWENCSFRGTDNEEFPRNTRAYFRTKLRLLFMYAAFLVSCLKRDWLNLGRTNIFFTHRPSHPLCSLHEVCPYKATVHGSLPCLFSSFSRSCRLLF